MLLLVFLYMHVLYGALRGALEVLRRRWRWWWHVSQCHPSLTSPSSLHSGDGWHKWRAEVGPCSTEADPTSRWIGPTRWPVGSACVARPLGPSPVTMVDSQVPVRVHWKLRSIFQIYRARQRLAFYRASKSELLLSTSVCPSVRPSVCHVKNIDDDDDDGIYSLISTLTIMRTSTISKCLHRTIERC